MKLNVITINEIKAQHEIQAPETLNIYVHMKEYQVRKLLSEIILNWGEDKILKWIEQDR